MYACLSFILAYDISLRYFIEHFIAPGRENVIQPKLKTTWTENKEIDDVLRYIKMAM